METNSCKLFVANASSGLVRNDGCKLDEHVGKHVVGCPAQWTKGSEVSISAGAESSSGDPSAEDRRSLQRKSYPARSSGSVGTPHLRLRVEGAGRFVVVARGGLPYN